MKAAVILTFVISMPLYPLLAQVSPTSSTFSTQSTLTSVSTPLSPSIVPTVTSSVQSQIVLTKDTPVELMAYSEISTADVKAGSRFKLVLNKPIVIGGKTVVPTGTPAFGEVVAARDSGGLGKSGRMTAKLLFLRLGTQEIPLSGDVSAKGTGAGSAGVAALLVGPVGLFHRGNNAKIKAGEIVAGFVAVDTPLVTETTPEK